MADCPRPAACEPLQPLHPKTLTPARSSGRLHAESSSKRLSLSAHHLHGGAGYVVEHPLHYHAERAQALCIRYTPEAPALAAIATSLLE